MAKNTPNADDLRERMSEIMDDEMSPKERRARLLDIARIADEAARADDVSDDDRVTLGDLANRAEDAASNEDDGDGDGGGEVEVDSYERDGHTVRAYSRSRRGKSENTMSKIQDLRAQIAALQDEVAALEKGDKSDRSDIVGAFARDPIDPDEAERLWAEFERFADDFEADPRGGDTPREYVETARDDFEYVMPMGRDRVEQALQNYRNYLEQNYERAKSATFAESGKAAPASAHKLYA